MRGEESVRFAAVREHRHSKFGAEIEYGWQGARTRRMTFRLNKQSLSPELAFCFII
jgi:hypothetical protein